MRGKHHGTVNLVTENAVKGQTEGNIYQVDPLCKRVIHNLVTLMQGNMKFPQHCSNCIQFRIHEFFFFI